MKISLLHPSRNRAAKAETALAEWMGKRSGLHPIEYILSIDTSDRQASAYRQLAERHGARLVVSRNRNYVQACNQAARRATGDLLIQMADDFGCPENWDEALVRAIGERRDVAVLVDDGLGARTMTLPIVDRAFYERFGYLHFPGYAHMYSDNDLEEVARRRGKLIEAKHLLFPHRHFSSGDSPYDDTYHRAGNSWGRGALTFAKRRARDFDLRPARLDDLVKCGWFDLHYFLVGRPRSIMRGAVRRFPKWLPYVTALRTALLHPGQGLKHVLRRLARPRLGRPRRIPGAGAQTATALENKRPARLAVIVPFREAQNSVTLSQGAGRERQLAQFVEHLTGFLTIADYHIFIIEQSRDGLPFNKGYLMNVGFNLAAPDFDYFAFHDVDQLPTDPRNTYAFPSEPLHLCVVSDGRQQYRTTVGGALLINKDDFIACNGWSNRYLGWGQEDDDMAARLENSVGFRRVAPEVGTYTSLAHPRVPGLDETYQFQRNRRYLEQSAPAINPADGYRDAAFDVLSRTRVSDRCTRFIVSIDGPSARFGYHCYVKRDTPAEVALHEHASVRSPIIGLHDCVIDRTKITLRAGGGEMPSQPIPEEQEYAVFAPGALQLRQPGALDAARFGGYQQTLLAGAEVIRPAAAPDEEPVTTFVVERREYVNFYHTLIELFNAYVAIQLLARAEPFNLLFLDGHCRGSLDPIWPEILKPSRVLRLHDLARDTTRFRKLVLVPGGYDSPLYHTGPLEPCRFENFLSDFIATVLAAYGIDEPPGNDRLLTFVERRDHKAHPRSDGVVCRKVENVEASIALLQRLYPEHQVERHSFEAMPMAQQLRIVRQSDVLCGVHGAALTHVLFMRPGSELVEFTPRAYRRTDMFKHLAGFMGVRYQRFFADTRRVLPGDKLVVELTTRPG